MMRYFVLVILGNTAAVLGLHPCNGSVVELWHRLVPVSLLAFGIDLNKVMARITDREHEVDHLANQIIEVIAVVVNLGATSWT